MTEPKHDAQNIERRYCGDHSGVTAQQTLVLWLLGILISLVISVVGLLGLQYNGIANIDKQVSIIPIQLELLAKGQQDLTNDVGELDQRVHDLEARTEGIAVKQGNFIDNVDKSKKPAVKQSPKVDKSWWAKRREAGK